QLFDISVGQAVAQVPPDRDHDHLRRKPEPNERGLLSKDSGIMARTFHCASVPRHVWRQRNSPLTTVGGAAAWAGDAPIDSPAETEAAPLAAASKKRTKRSVP